MNRQDKIELINTLNKKVIDADADGETCYYVVVPLDGETRSVLRQLKKSDKWIDANADQDADGPMIDIAPVSFEFANWWNEGTGFSAEAPED